MSKIGKWLRPALFPLLIVVAFIVVIVFVFRSQNDIQTVNVSTILNHIKTDISISQQDTLTVSSDSITLIRGKDQKNSPRETATINDNFNVTQVLKDNDINYANNTLLILQYDTPGQFWAWMANIGSLLPILLLVFVLFFIWRQMQGTNSQTLSFVKSRARMFMGSKELITFADVAGVEEAKQELQEIVEFLKYPEKFVALGARIPKG